MADTGYPIKPKNIPCDCTPRYYLPQFTTTAPIQLTCEHCGGLHQAGQTCPRIKAVEYYESGAIKRVEYRD